MKELIEITQIVTKHKLRPIQVLGQDFKPSTEKTRFQNFYKNAMEGRFATDEDAADYFFGVAPSDIRYRKLKSAFKKQLVSHLFFLSDKTNDQSDIQKAMRVCYKNWATINLLLRDRAHYTAIQLCKKTLSMALKCEFSELAYSIAKELRSYYGQYEYNLKKFEYYNAIFKDYEQIVFYENLAIECYTIVSAHYVKSRDLKPVLQQQVQDYLKELEPSLLKYDSLSIHAFVYYIEMAMAIMEHDYNRTIQICQKAISFVESKMYVHMGFLSLFVNHSMSCHIQLKQYIEGKECVKKAETFIVVGTYNFFKIKELHLRLCLHTKKYQEAYDLYNETIVVKGFKVLPASIQEVWNIYKAYIHYLVALGLIKADENDKQFSNFRLGQFLNQVPTYSKDKRGLNIPILVIQILFLVKKQRYDESIDRVEAIEKYCSRYLKDTTTTIRSYYFIKMLLQMSIAGFNRKETSRRANRYLEKLNTHPLESSNQAYDVECIPYEDLWDLALKSLMPGTSSRKEFFIY